MARSIEDIYNIIVAEKQSFAELNSLMPQYNLEPPVSGNPFVAMINEVSTSSKVAVWKMWAYITAMALYTHEVLWDKFKAEAEEIASQSIAGNLAWYAAQVRQWQYGSFLMWNHTTYRYYYLDVNTPAAAAKRIVKKVSCIEVNNASLNGVLIKVAKENAGQLVPLDTPQLDSLRKYIQRIKFAGVQTSVISLPADKIKLNLKIYYDGTLELAVFKTTVESAIKEYLKNIEFDGVLYLNELIDVIQKIPGTKEPWVFVNGCQCRADSQVGYNTITERYEPESGYFELVPIGTNANLDSFIQYVAV